MSGARYFDGDFETLPFAAHLRFGEVPTHPTPVDYFDAQARARSLRVAAAADSYAADAITLEIAAATWHVEAIQERRLQADGRFDLARIASRVASSLHWWARGGRSEQERWERAS